MGVGVFIVSGFQDWVGVAEGQAIRSRHVVCATLVTMAAGREGSANDELFDVDGHALPAFLALALLIGFGLQFR